MIDKILVEDISKRAHHIYNQCQELVKEYMPEKQCNTNFEFLIKEDEEINGKSLSENDKDYVEINSGVIELHYNYFSDVMKQEKNKLLRSIAKNLDENEVENMSYEAVIYNGTKKVILDSKIIDDRRAKLLDIFVSRFIILHEFGHVFNGHCKLLGYLSSDKKCFMPMFYNKNKKDLTEQEALNIRTMEMDADAFATTQSMWHLIYLYNNFENEVDMVNMKPQELFYWWVFAIRSHFLICQDRFMDNYYYKKMTHLPSSARWNLICNLALEFLDNINMNTAEKEIIMDAICSAALDAEKKFNEIKMTHYSWVEEIQQSDYYEEYIEEVNNNWKIIKISLNEYTRLPLY